MDWHVVTTPPYNLIESPDVIGFPRVEFGTWISSSPVHFASRVQRRINGDVTVRLAPRGHAKSNRQTRHGQGYDGRWCETHRRSVGVVSDGGHTYAAQTRYFERAA